MWRTARRAQNIPYEGVFAHGGVRAGVWMGYREWVCASLSRSQRSVWEEVGGGADQEQPMGLELGFAARWMLALVRVAGVGGDQIRGSATRDT